MLVASVPYSKAVKAARICGWQHAVHCSRCLPCTCHVTVMPGGHAQPHCAPAVMCPRCPTTTAPQVGVKTIKTLAERMRNEGVQRAIMVTQVGQGW